MAHTAEIPNQPISLAEYLNVELETLRKMMHNKQLIDGRFNRYAELDQSTVDTLVEIYKPEEAEPEIAGRVTDTENRKTEEAEDGTGIAGEGQSSLETENGNTKKKAGKSDFKKKRKAERAKTEEVASVETGKEEVAMAPTGALVQFLLLLVALVSMYVQMDHTAQVIIADATSVSVYDKSKSWMFAFGVQFTGLSMSLFKGNQWYLRGYAAADFVINLLYYRPWVKNTSEMWIQSLLLSALLVLTIFSYTQIATGFLKAKKQNHE